MTTKWTRAEWDHMCGGCGVQLRIGDPMQVQSITGVHRPRVRCPNCAEGAPPPDLPPLPARIVEYHGRTKRMKSVRAIAAGTDWKSKASGD